MNKRQLLDLLNLIPDSAEEITILGVTEPKLGFTIPIEDIEEMAGSRLPFHISRHPRDLSRDTDPRDYSKIHRIVLGVRGWVRNSWNPDFLPGAVCNLEETKASIRRRKRAEHDSRRP